MYISDFHTSEAGQGGNVTARQTDAELNWFLLKRAGRARKELEEVCAGFEIPD